MPSKNSKDAFIRTVNSFGCAASQLSLLRTLNFDLAQPILM